MKFVWSLLWKSCGGRYLMAQMYNFGPRRGIFSPLVAGWLNQCPYMNVQVGRYIVQAARVIRHLRATNSPRTAWLTWADRSPFACKTPFFPCHQDLSAIIDQLQCTNAQKACEYVLYSNGNASRFVSAFTLQWSTASCAVSSRLLDSKRN